MNKIEKLTKEQFAEETSVIYLNVFQEIDKLFDKYTKIDSEFEKEIDELHKRSVEQMIEYGKVLAKKPGRFRPTEKAKRTLFRSTGALKNNKTHAQHTLYIGFFVSRYIYR